MASTAHHFTRRLAVSHLGSWANEKAHLIHAFARGFPSPWSDDLCHDGQAQRVWGNEDGHSGWLWAGDWHGVHHEAERVW
jgi:hypothetical protein